MKKIILASQSPRRKQLLSLLYSSFEIIPSHVDEDIPFKGNPEQYVKDLSLQKAKEVAKQQSNGLIIGSDTIVVLNNELLGKPLDRQDAIKILTTLSGNAHKVYTGVSLIEVKSQKTFSFAVETVVYFRELEQNEIEAYVDSGSPMDKAGAYGIQDDWGSLFVSKVEGDFYTVVGFPLHQFYQYIKQYFPAYLPKPKSRN